MLVSDDDWMHSDAVADMLSECLTKEDSYGSDRNAYGLLATTTRVHGGIGLNGMLSTPPLCEGLEQSIDGPVWTRLRQLSCAEVLTANELAEIRRTGATCGAAFGEDL